MSDTLRIDPLSEPIAAVDPRASDQARRAAEASARSRRSRPRRIDPATSDRDYTQAELEFMRAMQAYKQSSGRMFPTWSEVLEVVRGLGYEKEIPRCP